MPFIPPHEWGLQSDITPRFGTRLVQEGNRLYYLADRAGLTGEFTSKQLQKLDQAFPLFIRQLEAILRSGELNPQQQRQVTIQLASLTCIADTRGSCGYVYISIYPTLLSSSFLRILLMHISTVPATVPVSSRLSPVQVWKQLLMYLLEHHYGLALNDTPFHDDAAIQEHIEAGITLADAVNFLVERYELVRTDRKGFTWQVRTPFLTATDILRARRATGLINT